MTTERDQDGKDMGDYGREHEGKGMADKLAGKVQEGMGKLTGDRSQEAKGKLRQGQGNLEGAVGSTEQKLDDASR